MTPKIIIFDVGTPQYLLDSIPQINTVKIADLKAHNASCKEPGLLFILLLLVNLFDSHTLHLSSFLYFSLSTQNNHSAAAVTQ